jgi:hypothetical protein
MIGFSTKTDDMSMSPPSSDAGGDLLRVYKFFVLFGVLGICGVLLYSIAISDSVARGAATFGGAVLTAGAAIFVGAIIGFIFAIPRSRQQQEVLQATSGSDTNRPHQRLSDYAANTNLEQISDWLTKILVGISLVQFNALLNSFGSIATTIAPMLGGGPVAQGFALALLTYSSLWGFFFAYLSTRLWMPKALSRAEREEEVRKRLVEDEVELRAVERQAYERLYEGPPGGFTRAIEVIETYHNKPGSLRSPWLWVYLAAAYGQKHSYETTAGHLESAQTAKEHAIPAVEEALRLGAETRPILQQLYRGSDPNENDLASLQGDERLDTLLGK